MRLRQSQKILRIHASKHKKTNHEQLYSEMLLFSPWNDEEKELYPDNESKCKEEYLKRCGDIEANRYEIYPFAKSIEVMQEMVNTDFERPAHIYENLDAEGQQDNLECEDDMEPLDETELPDEPEDPNNPRRRPSKKPGLNRESFIVKPMVLPNREQMIQNARSLSFQQKLAFNKFVDYCKRIIIQRTGHYIEIIAPKLVVTG